MNAEAVISITRDGSPVGQFTLRGSATSDAPAVVANSYINNISFPVGSVFTIDEPGAGTVTYAMTVTVNTSDTSFVMQNCRLVAMEV
jgi:hypothetical protein